MNQAFLIAVMAILVVSSTLLVDNGGFQSADAGSDTNCPSKSGTATIDPNAHNAVNTNTPLTTQPMV